MRFPFFLICLGFVKLVYGGTLAITINNIPSSQGNILIGIYNKALGFTEIESTFLNKSLKAQKGQVSIILSLPDGEYGISVFHDKNENGMLDKNIFGMPTEYYGFSNNARNAFSAPSFEQCKFELKEKKKIIINLS